MTLCHIPRAKNPESKMTLYHIPRSKISHSAISAWSKISHSVPYLYGAKSQFMPYPHRAKSHCRPYALGGKSHTSCHILWEGNVTLCTMGGKCHAVYHIPREAEAKDRAEREERCTAAVQSQLTEEVTGQLCLQVADQVYQEDVVQRLQLLAAQQKAVELKRTSQWLAVWRKVNHTC